jgi:3-hydroxyisobutyrate dehydrogenase
MVGGDAAALERARPVLQAMGKTITHIGPNGMGQACKLANQIAVGLHNLSLGEALIFAMKAGADPERVLQALQGGAANSWAFQVLAPKILKRDFSPGFMVKLQQKDLRLVLEAARELHLPLPGTALTHQLYQAVETRGGGNEGNHALVKALEALAGIEVQKKQ